MVDQLRPAGLHVTCSFGVATADADAVEFASLMTAADAALYEAKRAGRNRVESPAEAAGRRQPVLART